MRKAAYELLQETEGDPCSRWPNECLRNGSPAGPKPVSSRCSKAALLDSIRMLKATGQGLSASLSLAKPCSA